MVDGSSLQCYGAQATLAQEQLYAAEHCLEEESTVEEVLVVSAGYGQVVFPVPSCNIPYTYPCFWRTDMLIDHPSAIEKGNQHHFARWLANKSFCPGFTTLKPHL